MKISQIRMRNFRAYKDEVTVDIKNLTAFIGKNDVGKSTILEALDIFFNGGAGVVKIDKEDINKSGEDTDIVIAVSFEELPEKIIIDATNETDLESEYLLNKNKNLEVIKHYENAGKEKVSIKAEHPSNPDCAYLLLKKQGDLKKIIKDKSIDCAGQHKNASLRQAIWKHYKDDLQLKEGEIDVTKEGAKEIWEQLKKYMPLYFLFQSDRKNSDGDSEIQDPMKLAVKEIIKDTQLEASFEKIASEVSNKLRKVADNTLKKLKEMNPEIANSLNPVIPSTENLKWADVFKNVSISGDQDIPINKRGSGVKRLVLLNFFRAEAERRASEETVQDIIYAIEEPETSQHPEHQRKLIDAFKELSDQRQVILTTHSPAIVKMLDFCNLKLIKKSDDKLEIRDIEKKTLPFPSLNEVVFLAYDESEEDYHNELYGFIEDEGWLDEFEKDKDKRCYKRKNKQGEEKKEDIILSKYIRHQIHHPENDKNIKYTDEELRSSIQEMRDFIIGQKQMNYNGE